MSSQDYTKKTDKVRKELNTLRKDINYRDEQEKRGQATYTLDAEINGQFTQINEELDGIQTTANNFKNNWKDYNLTMAEAGKRYKIYETLLNDKNSLKRAYDALFQKKALQRQIISAKIDAPSVKIVDIQFDQKYDTNKLSKKDMNDIRYQQQKDQDEVLDELLVNVKNLKSGGKVIGQQLNQHDKLLATLDNKMDNNIDNMSSARRRMTKLLESSSNCCLISVMVVEIAIVVVIWIFM